MADAIAASAAEAGLRMPLEEAMTTQRAIRRLRPDPVDDALVLRLIALALKAPTGSNLQNWEFVIVKDRAVKARLARLNRQAWRLYGGIGRWLARNDPPMQRIIQAVQWQADHFEEIPVLVVACLRGLVPPLPRIAAASAYGSIFPSVQNLLLAARAAGLGAALITLPLWSTFLARRAPSCHSAGRAAATGPRGGGRWATSCTSTGGATSPSAADGPQARSGRKNARMSSASASGSSIAAKCPPEGITVQRLTA